MADIRIVCSECGQENVFSEYSRPETRRCRKCDSPLASEQSAIKRKLRVRKMEADGGGGGDLSSSSTPPEAGGKQSATTPKDKAESGHKPKSPSSFLLGLLLFIVLGGILLGLQYYGRTDQKLGTIYSIVRLAALGLGFLLVVVDAFMEGQIPGFLALLFPPYLAYYALVRLDSFWRQGIFLAVVLMLAAEMYFMKNDALITHANRYIQKKIDYVSEQLDKAGKPEVPAL